MSLISTIRGIERVAVGQPMVHTVIRGDALKLNGRTDVKYGAFVWVQGQHKIDVWSGMAQYNFSFFYVDRLKADKSNMAEIQSVGMTTLKNILKSLPEVWSVESGEMHPFDYRFTDECAGVWASVSIGVAEGARCSEETDEIREAIEERAQADGGLLNTIAVIEEAAVSHDAVRTIARGDVLKLNEKTDTRYGAFAWVQGVHKADLEGGVTEYQFSLFYVDRLTADKGNETEVQSVGCEVLTNVTRMLPEVWEVSLSEVHPFGYRFKDECAGVWAGLSVKVADTYRCGEEIEGDFNEDFNDDFLVGSGITII